MRKFPEAYGSLHQSVVTMSRVIYFILQVYRENYVSQCVLSVLRLKSLNGFKYRVKCTVTAKGRMLESDLEEEKNTRN